MHFTLNEFKTAVHISNEIPDLREIAHELGMEPGDSTFKPLLIADENTSYIAQKICGRLDYPCCVLKSGEENKNWQAAETIHSAAVKAGLGRDGIFIAVGGGVICDLASFAASVYMRGCRLVLTPTTLLCMVDASIGGKTGFDLFGIKNLIGSFYPAETVYLPIDALSTLPEREMKSGMAEIIKTAILAGGDFLDKLNDSKILCGSVSSSVKSSSLLGFIERAVAFKGGIVSEDLRESANGKRQLLNLGHTFGHALESAAGLGRVSHGEAVAWGIVRACELGCEFGITPGSRSEKIRDLIASFGYETKAPHPLAGNIDALLDAMKNDKKKHGGKIKFIVPDEECARSAVIETEEELKLVRNILSGNI